MSDTSTPDGQIDPRAESLEQQGNPPAPEEAPNPNAERLNKDGSEREFLVNVRSRWTVAEEMTGGRVKYGRLGGEIYLSSQIYEALDGSTESTTGGIGDDDRRNLEKDNMDFMEHFMTFMREAGVLTGVMGGSRIRFDKAACGVLEDFVIQRQNSRVVRPRGLS